jgi:hypothetical protein
MDFLVVTTSYFPDLDEAEVGCAGLVNTSFLNPGTVDEGAVQALAAATADYKAMVNRSLRDYAEVDYADHPDQKVEAKAVIAFAFDFLSLLVDITKTLDVAAALTDAVEEQLGLVEDMVLNKDRLIESVYKKRAERELRLFHDENTRSKLEKNLQ